MIGISPAMLRRHAGVAYRVGVIRVVLADDSRLIRQGLMASVDEHSPDVAITDVRMPPTHTDEVIRTAPEIRQRAVLPWLSDHDGGRS
jgi:YesN/AraC family two-component response regulator